MRQSEPDDIPGLECQEGRSRLPIAVAFSLLLHCAVVLAAILPRQVTTPQPAHVIAIELVSAADLAAIRSDRAESPAPSPGPGISGSGNPASFGPGPGQDLALPSEDGDVPEASMDQLDLIKIEPVLEPEPHRFPAFSGSASARNNGPAGPGVAPAAGSPPLTAPGPSETMSAQLLPLLKPLPLHPPTAPVSFSTPGQATTGEPPDGPVGPENGLSQPGRGMDDAGLDEGPGRQTATATDDNNGGGASGPADGVDDSAGDGLRSPPRAGVSGPVNPVPRYPYSARRWGQEGQVVLRVQVTAAGHVQTVAILESSGFAVLDEAAIEAVRQWRFVPATREDTPVAGSVDVPIRFDLTD